jgi:hypothetical protein
MASKRLPDFTIDDPASGVKVFWEHLGMLDRRSYREKCEQKLGWYHSHGILPAAEGGGPNGTLVTSQDDARGGIDSHEIERRVRTELGIES